MHKETLAKIALEPSEHNYAEFTTALAEIKTLLADVNTEIADEEEAGLSELQDFQLLNELRIRKVAYRDGDEGVEKSLAALATELQSRVDRKRSIAH